jgi:hypothetical protein
MAFRCAVAAGCLAALGSTSWSPLAGQAVAPPAVFPPAHTATPAGLTRVVITRRSLTGLALAPDDLQRARGVNGVDPVALVLQPAADSQITRSPWWAPFASAVVPGTGQVALGQRRAVPYLAAEGFAALQYVHAITEGRRRQREYQDLARNVARRFLSEQGPDGDFEYYERMQQYVESGVFDMIPGGSLQPELDTATFNGAQWLLARRTFWEDPFVEPPRDSEAYRAAVAFYERRAIPPDFRWSWRNAQLEQDLFRRTIQRSNDAFRRSAEYLSALIANHVLSAVDAFVTLRVRRGGGPRRGYGIEATVPWAPFSRPAPK